LLDRSGADAYGGTWTSAASIQATPDGSHLYVLQVANALHGHARIVRYNQDLTLDTSFTPIEPPSSFEGAFTVDSAGAVYVLAYNWFQAGVDVSGYSVEAYTLTKYDY